jgi:hypothetical protein
MGEHFDLLNETEHAHDDRPSTGLILCAEKDNIEVELALNSRQPKTKSARPANASRAPLNGPWIFSPWAGRYRDRGCQQRGIDRSDLEWSARLPLLVTCAALDRWTQLASM